MSSDKKESLWLRLFSTELAAAVVLLLFSCLFFGIVVNQFVFEKKDFIDARIFDWIAPYRTENHTKIALMITFCGTGGFLIPVYLLIVILLWRQKKKKHAISTIVIALVSLLLGLLLKDVFRRDRPAPPNLDGAGGYSFPSGHALGGFTFSGVMIYLIWESGLSTTRKWIFTLLLFIFALLVAASRIYLHVHFATDTLGSFFLAMMWLSLSFICFQFIQKNKQYAG